MLIQIQQCLCKAVFQDSQIIHIGYRLGREGNRKSGKSPIESHADALDVQQEAKEH